MDFSEFGDWAIALVNTRADDDARDPLLTLHGLKSFPYELTGGGRAQTSDLIPLRIVREQLAKVFEAQTSNEAASHLNQVLRNCEFQPHLVYSVDQGLHLQVASDRAPTWRWIAAACGLGMVSLLMDHGAQRLGVCASPGCRRVFLDRSRAGNRQFCSVACGNRVHASAFRERRRTLNHQVVSPR
jgi:predicted RNA-binding Zn ribbon-like protein